MPPSSASSRPRNRGGTYRVRSSAGFGGRPRRGWPAGGPPARPVRLARWPTITCGPGRDSRRRPARRIARSPDAAAVGQSVAGSCGRPASVIVPCTTGSRAGRRRGLRRRRRRRTGARTPATPRPSPPPRRPAPGRGDRSAVPSFGLAHSRMLGRGLDVELQAPRGGPDPPRLVRVSHRGQQQHGSRGQR